MAFRLAFDLPAGVRGPEISYHSPCLQRVQPLLSFFSSLLRLDARRRCPSTESLQKGIVELAFTSQRAREERGGYRGSPACKITGASGKLRVFDSLGTEPRD